jgi:hypothetical protein
MEKTMFETNDSIDSSDLAVLILFSYVLVSLVITKRRRRKSKKRRVGEWTKQQKARERTALRVPVERQRTYKALIAFTKTKNTVIIVKNARS